MSHFLRGLGFPMDPFVRGLLFYYGLEFHDLAPESILHISSFIVVCEAFLRVTPHFGLWPKTSKVEPKMIEGRHCRGFPGLPEHLWGRSPFSVRRGAEVAQRADRGEARGGRFLPSFGALRIDNTPTAALWILLSSCSGAPSATVHSSS